MVSLKICALQVREIFIVNILKAILNSDEPGMKY